MSNAQADLEDAAELDKLIDEQIAAALAASKRSELAATSCRAHHAAACRLTKLRCQIPFPDVEGYDPGFGQQHSRHDARTEAAAAAAQSAAAAAQSARRPNDAGSSRTFAPGNGARARGNGPY